jgi:hypothetical protein
MMPGSAAGWLLFTFFAGGALGGWAVLWLIAREYWKDVLK